MEKTYADKKWDVLSYLVIGFLLLLLVGRWPLLPNFIDIYYHIVTAQGFAQAGGYVTHDFWSYAPQGRPHLYPPVFHIALLALLKTGIPPVALARLADIVIFPFFLLVIFFFMRNLLSSRLAFFSVLLSASVYSFYLASSNFIPATLACIFGMLSLWAMERNRTIAASALLGLCFYTHAQMPWFFVAVYVLYGIMRRARLARCAVIIAGGLMLGAPMLIYLYRMRAFYIPAARYENFALEFNLYLALACFGIRKIFYEKKTYILLGSLALASAPFVASYPYRYLSGQGILGLILLSAVGIELCYEAAARSLGARAQSKGVALLIFTLSFAFLSPAIIVQRDHRQTFSLLNSTYSNLIDWNPVARPNDFSVSNSRYVRQVVDIVRRNSAQHDIIATNMPYAGTVISALSGRADAQGMLAEVRPAPGPDPFAHARLIIWFKDDSLSGARTLAQIVSAYSLRQIAETDIAFIVRNNATESREQVGKAVIPSWALAAIFVCLLFVIGQDVLCDKTV
jgi:hypothetical protein